ncbi:MAG: selenide, water dikinase SelD [Cyanobacteriota bacterium]
MILAGGGPTHALLLLQWAMRPQQRPTATRITLVNRHSTALYSGLVPALVAGLVSPEDCAIPLRTLCDRADVAFVQAEITGLQLQEQRLLLLGRPPLRFDFLSFDLGAVTATPASGASTPPLAVKPLEPFLAWCTNRASEATGTSSSVRIRGGGAAAVEVALALRRRGLAPRLLLRGQQLHLGSAAANRCGERLLDGAGIAVEREVDSAAAADLACTGSRAPAWLAASGLPVQPGSGRVLTHPSLEVLQHPRLFACGDCAVIATAPRPASGVWAVRAAPVLAHNLRRRLADPQAALRAWRPQAWALQLLGDGGGPGRRPRAVACWGPWALGPHPLLWHWKQRIDRRFIERFRRGSAMADATAAPMACRGCAAKLAAQPLAAALADLAALAALENPEAPRGPAPAVAPPAEDAALVDRSPDGSLLLQSVDGFPALVSDLWLNARLTTLHACSDLWASGAVVESVQAVVTLPEGAAALQQEQLFQTLAGVRSVLDPQGARLIGGHSLEARDGGGFSLTLSVNGRVAAERFWPKGPLPPGTDLLLCRPIGSGVLFAAAMAAAARPEWIDGALELLLQSQAPLVEMLAAHGCHHCTDITGFGLRGHLGEMVGPGPGPRVTLDPQAIPALPGALELLAQGFASSLAPANAAALSLLEPQGAIRLQPAGGSALEPARLALLIDPQTCGPLLAAVPSERAAAALAELHAAGFRQAARIGWVEPGESALRGG